MISKGVYGRLFVTDIRDNHMLCVTATTAAAAPAAARVDKW